MGKNSFGREMESLVLDKFEISMRHPLELGKEAEMNPGMRQWSGLEMSQQCAARDQSPSEALSLISH